MTRKHGDVSSSPSEEPAMCYPSAPTLECNLCVRRRSGYAMPAERRNTVVIDGSVVHKGSCDLWIGRPVARNFVDTQ